ncbi:hypothetical protein [Salimicrobium album]|uniref:Uncharacterized protein n=1 Tax=Salimicrobium album TaxID=50717 RepID=A0A1H3BDC6_9BACI|nr:hypothetical protein [Salimicrobium album]SDX39953.1 hypothetical protein SAMN04488081_0399 [Salimicrobium album]
MFNNFTQPVWILTFYFIHGVLAFLLLLFLQKRAEEEEQGVVLWIFTVSLFLPVIGEIFGGMVWYMARRFGSNDILESYEEYVTYKPPMLEQIRYEARASYDMQPFSETLTDFEARSKQDAIMRLINSDVSRKGHYVNLGLTNQNSEMVHYAATTRNLLIDNHEKEIQLAKLEYTPDDTTSLKTLLSAYERFLKSELLEGPSLSRLEKEYKGFMEEELASGNDRPLLLERLGEFHLYRGDPSTGVEILESMNEKHPLQAEGYLVLLRYYYGRKDWKQIRSVLSALKENVPKTNIPESRRFIVEHLLGEEL